ncbi:MAG TPA: metal-sensitive transcriptional regulator [Cyclobacteriaceae bacterium]|jgi:DNA-binding FrmR family transcriptional regulator
MDETLQKFEMAPDPAPEVVHRLRTVCGHLDGIIHMAQAGEPCEKILHQLGAVQASIHGIGLSLLEKEILKSSVVFLSENSGDEDKLLAAKRILGLFNLFYKSPIKTYKEKIL